ncbi:hypothetical protein V496_00654 [Pseudogymnoascus sp. VKM F-4515 (FW-2607)]|nr:hypothetical protein V496_00654 [Pseudogymnoascus sp. VKM F-4515 (FW-2607)]KFY97759.1 hypothetical protein V498_01882 [Pseudogymnoascus sp. VKM F-4517 (FW-2822)]
MHLTTVFSLIVPALAFLGRVEGAPSRDYTSYEAEFNETSLSFDHFSLAARQDAKPALRIMPLGASIVSGVGSSTGNGDQLRFKGWPVSMVGSKQNGNMVDRNFEATSGHTIDQVRDSARNSYGYKPNVVLMNVGTNDANQGLVAGANTRMEALLNDLWAADGMSKTFVVISSVLRRDDSGAENNRKQINGQYKTMVTRLKNFGKPIEYIDIDIPLNELTDGIHPNDAGHKKMAIKFWYAIEWAHQSGLIAEASPFTQAEGNTCDKQAGQAQYGARKWALSYTSKFDRDQWFFTRLYGSKYDDIVGWWYADGVLTFATWKNNGGGKFSKISDLKTGLFCNPRGIWWVNINADGYDDFLCVSPNGDTLASINNRDGTATSPPTFKNIGVIKRNVGYLQDRVRWGDIDGDGRADYMIIDDGGNVRAWRNSGTADIPSWQPLGLRFTAKNMGDMRGVRFEDINGDGRDDWLWVSDTGATTTWTNSRSCQKGKAGDGLNVAWRQGFWNGASSGPTHAGAGATGRDRIHFARIYGEASFGLLPKADYVYLQMTKQTDGRFKFDMKVWKNTGGGSTKLKVDGNKYCNMHGHADGRQDYVWILSTGKMTVWPNLGKKSVTGDNDVFWGTPKDLWSPGRNLDRRDLHLVDWNNDGACDIAWVDPDNNNRVSVWLNNYKTTGAFTWTYLANPAPVLSCPEKRGVGIHDLPVRFADVSNNKMSDYICIQPDGRFHGWTHNSDGSWERIAQFKKAEGIDRANLRFGNVNGRGGEDMIWVDKYTGDATVFINRGKMETGGSNWWFLNSGKQYAGSFAGTCQYFVDLDGDNRADLHSIMATYTNRGETHFNRCGLVDLQGDDAGWDQGQDPGFGALPNNVPALPSDNEGWRDVYCDATPALSDALWPNGQERWRDAKANEGRESALVFKFYYQRSSADNPVGREFQFSEAIGNFFKASPDRKCQDVNDGNCGESSNCGQKDFPGDTNSPAGYMIMNNIASIHRVFKVIEDGVMAAYTTFSFETSAAVKAFGSFTDVTKYLVELDIMNLMFGFLGIGLWGRALPANAWASSFIQDGARSLVQFGVDWNKAQPSVASHLDFGEGLRVWVTKVALAYRDANRNAAFNHFSGLDTTALTNMLKDGNSVRMRNTTQAEVESIFYQNLMVYAIPQLWSTNGNYRTVLLTGQDLELKDNPSEGGCREYPGGYPIYFDSDLWEPTFWCYQRDGKPQSYWMVSVRTNCDIDERTGYCLTPGWERFNLPKGWDTIDGTQWGCLKKYDLFRSAIEAWENNGRKNGWKGPDAESLDGMRNIIEYGVGTDGAFKIPVCGWKEMWKSFSEGAPGPDKNPYWPCENVS